MLNLKPEQRIYYTLRLGVAMCFIGHGAFGIITKVIWCNYFAVFGIGHDAAYQLMPWLGIFDILMGLAMLFYPLKIIPLWLVIWGIITALLRPLSGEPFAEFIERAGNFGAPLGLLILAGNTGGKFISNLFKPINLENKVDEITLNRVVACLKIVGFLLLAGHGWLNVIEKKTLLSQYITIGISNPVVTAHAIGFFEILAGCIILIRPIRAIVFLIITWKISSELFYPHYELFEWIERGGSYCSLIALWLALNQSLKWYSLIKFPINKSITTN